MGKYTRNPKPSGDLAVVDVSLGVRTRAKTLALQRLTSSSSDYLELRSRRLQKPPLLWQYLQNSRKTAVRKREEEEARIESSIEKPKPKSIGEEKEGCLGSEAGNFEVRDLEIEVSLGGNNLDTQVRERSTRESTPCSLIRSTDNISTPGSSTKQRSPVATNRSVQNVFRNVPTPCELEEFFSCAEQAQQNRFIDKYNFDIVNDTPVPGRYEWIRVTP